MILLNIDMTDFISSLISSLFNILGQYIHLLRSVDIFNIDGNHITAFELRIGVLFLQIFFGIIFILAPRNGEGSVFKGNGI